MSKRSNVTTGTTADVGATIRSQAKTWSERSRWLCAVVDEADGGLQTQIAATRRFRDLTRGRLTEPSPGCGLAYLTPGGSTS